jgi:hypothetical protein
VQLCAFFKGDGTARFSKVASEISAYRTRVCWDSFHEERLAKAKSLQASFEQFVEANFP